MIEKLTYSLLGRNKTGSRFDWINIDRGLDRIGKIRALIEGGTLTIFSINIFPEFERKGYARKVINTFKASFNRITADRVRHTAVGFWIKMGFVNAGRGRYVYDKCVLRFKGSVVEPGIPMKGGGSIQKENS